MVLMFCSIVGVSAGLDVVDGGVVVVVVALVVVLNWF